MRNRTKIILWLFAVYIVSCFLIASFSFGQEMPKPGTVIDKSNYKTYAHLLPAEILPAFEDGFGGLIEPASIKVIESKLKEYLPLKSFLALSAENKGKYSLSADGKIQGGWRRQGFPFPDLQMGDKDFLTKFMWNFSARYVGDDLHMKCYGYMQRRGEPPRWNHLDMGRLYFVNRQAVPPKPLMKNTNDVAWAGLFHYEEPSTVRNMMTLSLRYMDVNKADEVFIYLPNLRRVLRGDSGQRSVPLQGNLAALDDIDLFDGKTDEFTYKLVGEQKILAPLEERNLPDKSNFLEGEKLLPYPSEQYTITDVYVIDIFSKNPVYPQSKKRIWIDKNASYAYYAAVWDRAGKLWKVWYTPATAIAVPGDNPFPTTTIGGGVDLQFGMSSLVKWSTSGNRGGVSWEDFSPTSLLKKAQ